MRVALSSLLLLLAACGDSSSGGGTERLTEDLSPEETQWASELVDLVNDHRSALGLRDLSEHTSMHLIAKGHSQNMAQGRVGFGHTGFSGRCRAAKTALGGGNWCAENVARGQATPALVFASWLSSGNHRDNIENPRATHMGVGFVPRPGGPGHYWTQLFLEH
jgi:uncharacterized protein YkwD